MFVVLMSTLLVLGFVGKAVANPACAVCTGAIDRLTVITYADPLRRIGSFFIINTKSVKILLTFPVFMK